MSGRCFPLPNRFFCFNRLLADVVGDFRQIPLIERDGGNVIGLANKEVLVSSGQLVMQAVRESGAELVPVDSEHNGAQQCLRAGNREAVSKLILTASGGPFACSPDATATAAQSLKDFTGPDF